MKDRITILYPCSMFSVRCTGSIHYTKELKNNTFFSPKACSFHKKYHTMCCVVFINWMDSTLYSKCQYNISYMPLSPSRQISFRPHLLSIRYYSFSLVCIYAYKTLNHIQNGISKIHSENYFVYNSPI